MAVKHTQSKDYAVSYDLLCSILKLPEMADGLKKDEMTISSKMPSLAKHYEVTVFMNVVNSPDGIEFQYIKAPINVNRSSLHGRNYFVKLQCINDNNTRVIVTTQSRQHKVLLDTVWKNEVNKVFSTIDELIHKSVIDQAKATE